MFLLYRKVIIAITFLSLWHLIRTHLNTVRTSSKPGATYPSIVIGKWDWKNPGMTMTAMAVTATRRAYLINDMVAIVPCSSCVYRPKWIFYSTELPKRLKTSDRPWTLDVPRRDLCTGILIDTDHNEVDRHSKDFANTTFSNVLVLSCATEAQCTSIPGSIFKNIKWLTTLFVFL